ncbi:MAG: cyclophane-forming radical SAM peptide maturase AmcB [Pseudonocardiaceae bacterium]
MAKARQRLRADELATQAEIGDWISGIPETIIMQPTTLCNLDCTYCYLSDRKKKRDMSPQVARAIASSIPAICPQFGSLEVVWHGGEPLAIGSGGLVELLEPFESLRQAGQIRHTIQTNATLINDEWCDLFMIYNISVGVSIDGPRDVNSNRVDRRGFPIFDRIIAGIETMKSHGIPFSVIAVIDHESVGRAREILDFLTELECPLVGFNMEEKEGVNIHRRTPTMAQARNFWQDVFLWSKSNPQMRVREVDRLLDFLSLGQAARHADGKHDLIPTVAWNGDVVVLSPELLGTCAPLYGDFIVGNVLTDPLPAILNRAFKFSYVREFQLGIEQCKATCEFFAYCQGSHAGNRYFEHGTFTATETEHCRTSTQALILALHDIASNGL